MVSRRCAAACAGARAAGDFVSVRAEGGVAFGEPGRGACESSRRISCRGGASAARFGVAGGFGEPGSVRGRNDCGGLHRREGRGGGLDGGGGNVGRGGRCFYSSTRGSDLLLSGG